MIYVTYNDICEHSEHSDEMYGDWYESRSFSVTGVSSFKPLREHERFGIEMDSGSTAHVVTMHYSTGDSFGRSDGRGEVLWVFDNIDDAVAARKALEEQREKFSVEFKDGSGKVIKMSNPGAGYFESVNDISVETFTVT